MWKELVGFPGGGDMYVCECVCKMYLYCISKRI